MTQQEWKYCGSCGTPNHPKGHFCVNCGTTFDGAAAPVGEAEPAVVEKQEGSRRRWPIIAGIVVVGVCAVCVVGGLVLLLGGDGDVPDVAEQVLEADSASAVPELPPTPRPLAPPYEEIRTTVEGMTEAQWKQYLPTLEGKQVLNWSGWVVEVDESLGGEYELWVDMDPPGDFLSTQDIYIPVSSDLALSLGKGQTVTFSGYIERASELLGSVSLTLEEATVTP